MTPKERLHFIRQLHHWSEALIEVGRYPFRRAEMFPPILTVSGLQSPPLVLWVNRQSLQAGGVVFLAEDETDISAMAGCAQAIGINHFVLWTPQKLSLWAQPDVNALPEICWEGSTPRGQQVQDFQLQLTEIFDQLRDRLVSRAIADSHLTCEFFATLCYHTLLSIRQPLVERLRVARSTQKVSESVNPAHAAIEWGIALLLQALSSRFDEQTHNESGVGKKIQPMLAAIQPGINAPESVTVLLRQFEHRLRQLRWGSNRQIATDTLGRLVKHLSPALSCTLVLPRRLPLGGKRLFINMPVPTEKDIDFSPTSLQAIKTLGQLFDNQQPQPSLNSFHTLNTNTFDRIAAFLPHRPFTPYQLTDEQGKALLKKAWPNRRFSLPTKTPAWTYHALVILAAMKTEGELLLDLPKGWINAQAATDFFEIMARHFRLNELSETRQRHQLRLQRTPTRGDVLLNICDAETRTLPATSEQPMSLQMLRLALDTPKALWHLLVEGHLSRLTNEDPRLTLKDELSWFRASNCGKYLTHYLGEKEAIPTPSFELLSLFTGVSSTTEFANAESVLYVQLGIGEIDWNEDFTTSSGSGASQRSPRLPRAKILEELQLAARSTGVPRFPEQYLYDYFKPELIRYTFNGPLQVQGDFFGQIQLVDTEGQIIETDAATATALRLCSNREAGSVLLPQDQDITAKIVSLYRADIDSLSEKLHELANRHTDDQRRAKRLVNEIWEQLSLPPLKLLDKIDSIE